MNSMERAAFVASFIPAIALADVRTYNSRLFVSEGDLPGSLLGSVTGPFGVNAVAGDLLTLSTWDFNPDLDGDQSLTTRLDTRLRFFRPSGGLPFDDENGNIGVLAANGGTASETGLYTALVTGGGDTFFDGSHSSEGDFRLVMTSAPTAFEAPEQNDLPADAQALEFLNGAARTDGELDSAASFAGGDTDWYAFKALAGSLITAEALSDNGVSFFMGLFAPDRQTMLAADGSIGSGDGRNGSPALYYIAPETGTYYIALTGRTPADIRPEADDFFGRAHDVFGSYALVVSGGQTVPSPSAFGAIAITGLVATRRRR